MGGETGRPDLRGRGLDVSERPDDWEAQLKYGTLGEIAAVDRYGEVPMPRPDPRPSTTITRGELASQKAEAELAAAQAKLDRWLYPMGQMSRDAGVGDIVSRPPTAPVRFKEATQAQEDASLGGTMRGLTSQVNPDRFHQMQQTWPESTNVEYRGEPSLVMRARTWLPSYFGGYR
jgi:hypothetical protein